MRKLLLATVFCLTPVAAQAVPLSVVNVSAPAINCVFTTVSPCSIGVSDSVANIPLAGGATGRLQSRTHRGLPGSAAAGLYAYEYRVDLTSALAITAASCVQGISVPFGPVASLDYNGDRRPENVYVVTGGGLGSVGIASADQIGGVIRFTFTAPVCPGSSPGRGATSFFWGLVSKRPPRAITATVYQSLGPAISVGARAP
jgi:hypothetical protein